MTLSATLAFLRDAVLDEQPKLESQLALTLVLGVMWACAFRIVPHLLIPAALKSARIRAAVERHLEDTREQLSTFGFSKTREEARNHALREYPKVVLILSQHLLGGSLCLPALLGVGNPRVARALVCLGCLSEVGWEMQDMAERIVLRYTSPQGKSEHPVQFLLLLAVHHLAASGFGIPMILSYRAEPVFHALVFNLQFAAALAGLIAEFTKLLDLDDPRQLRLFANLSGMCAVAMVGTRGVWFTISAAKLVCIWWRDKAWTFLALGIPTLVLFSAFNLVVCIMGFCKRTIRAYKRLADISYPSAPFPSAGATGVGAAVNATRVQWEDARTGTEQSDKTAHGEGQTLSVTDDGEVSSWTHMAKRDLTDDHASDLLVVKQVSSSSFFLDALQVQQRLMGGDPYESTFKAGKITDNTGDDGSADVCAASAPMSRPIAESRRTGHHFSRATGRQPHDAQQAGRKRSRATGSSSTMPRHRAIGTMLQQAFMSVRRRNKHGGGDVARADAHDVGTAGAPDAATAPVSNTLPPLQVLRVRRSRSGGVAGGGCADGNTGHPRDGPRRVNLFSNTLRSLTAACSNHPSHRMPKS
mmetsp:Transcript_821/g.2249  ORF Transcript_821/g.2249 Transcript_821/m.2249 type:complete len:586 (+) Transcript_821:123-1880(+)